MSRQVARRSFFVSLLLATSVRAAAASLEDGIRDMATSLATSMEQNQVRKIAVVEFSDLNGYRSVLGSFIAEEVMTQLLLAKPGSFDVIERQQLAKVLQEQKLSSQALFDPNTIASVGRILGIQAIITGSIADLGEEIKINARTISIETAKVFSAASAKCQKAGTVEQLMRQGAAPGSVGVEHRLPERQVQASDVFFQNSFIRATVESISASQDERRVSLSLRLENLTASDLLIAVEQPVQTCHTALSDNQGNQMEPAGFYQDGAIGIACLDLDYEPTAESFTMISAKSRTTVTFPFRLPRKATIGNIFSFSAGFLKFDGGKITRFSVGLANIALKQ